MAHPDLCDGRIDVHHHMTRADSPLFNLPPGAVTTWWSEDAALRLMDENDIRVAILSHGGTLPNSMRLIKAMTLLRDSPLGRTRLVRRRMREWTRNATEEVAAVARRRPDRFGFFATIVPLDPEDSVREAAYALDQLGADGVFIPTNVGPVYLGDQPYEPLFAELDQRHATVFVHPLDLPRPLVSGVPAFLADFLLSTVRAATNLVQKEWCSVIRT